MTPRRASGAFGRRTQSTRNQPPIPRKQRSKIGEQNRNTDRSVPVGAHSNITEARQQACLGKGRGVKGRRSNAHKVRKVAIRGKKPGRRAASDACSHRREKGSL